MWVGKNVVITGGSTGLGKAIAELLVSKGASVAIIARRQNALEAAKEDIQKFKNQLLQKVITISADVTKQEEMDEAVKIAESEFGSTVDYLFCSAGIAQPGLFIDTPTEVFEQQMNLNYLGTVKTIKSFLPSMINDKKKNPKSKKHITIVSSAAGLAGFIGYSQYAPTKYAVRGLADSLRNEFLLYDIGVSVFHASSMNSPGFENEEKTKPQVTRDIEGTVKLWEPKDAAVHCVEAVEMGRYHITSEIMVELLRGTMNGATPRNYFLLEFLLSPIFPLIEVIMQKFIFDRTVINERKKHNK